MSYYENQPWSPASQATWDHQTPPARSGASSAIPREETTAFLQQIEEVDRAIDNLVKSGKMFGAHGRRESLPPPGPARMFPGRDIRPGPGPRPHSMADFDSRGPHQSNLQNFYASQRHQSSRGSSEAEQMMQAKRRMAAQRERELRNYHQEQQYNRTVLSEVNPYSNKPDRAMSPGGNMTEEERRELIARQRSALYGEGPFAESGGYVDETGTPRPGAPSHPAGPTSLRGGSPLAFGHPDSNAQGPDGGSGSHSAGPAQRSRTNSNSSPKSTPGAGKGVFEGPTAQQVSRASTSSPSGSPGTKPPGVPPVAPIGTRPSISGPSSSASAANSGLLNKRSTTPLPSPLSQGYSASRAGEGGTPNNTGGPTNPPSSNEGPMGISGGWGSHSGGWPNKSGLSVQASVWG